jgi:hypothetical protein
MSLVLALLAAFSGLVVKQWLREHIRWKGLSPRDSVHLRQIRREAFVGWGVGQVLTFLPAMIQASLIVFLVGLLDFMLHIIILRSVALPSTILISCIVGLVALGTLVVAPLLPECPYKTPLGLFGRLVMITYKTMNPYTGMFNLMFELQAEVRRLGYLRGPALFSWNMLISHIQATLTIMRAEGWVELEMLNLQSCTPDRKAGLEERALWWAHRTAVKDITGISACVRDIPTLKQASLLVCLISDAASSSIGEILICALPVGRFIPEEWNNTIQGLARTGRHTLIRLISNTVNVVRALESPIQVLSVHFEDLDGMAISEKVDLHKLLHLLLAGLSTCSEAINHSDWDDVLYFLIERLVLHRSLSALHILFHFRSIFWSRGSILGQNQAESQMKAADMILHRL